MTTKADLKAWQNRRCGSCFFWEKPPERRATADHAYPCNAPATDVRSFPAMASCFSLEVTRRPAMSRDEGRQCPRWEAKP